MHNKIIVYTTFRDFKGTDNDAIQLLFLESVKKQTHQNFLLAVTIFHEKNVIPVLEKSGLPYVIYNDPSPEYKFSWSSAMLNGITELKKHGPNSILLWVNADNMLEPDYFARVTEQFGTKVGGLTYPQGQYQSVDLWRAKKGFRYAWYGIDSAFFTPDVFTDECVKAIRKYPMNEFLYYEFFVCALTKVYCDRMVNIFPRGYNTIANNYVSLNQTRSVVKEAGFKNLARLKAFADEHGLPHKWYKLISSYKVTGNSPAAWWMAAHIHLQQIYAESYIRKAMPKLRRSLGLSEYR